MKILFIDNFSINFGVTYLSAVLKRAGHEVHLLVYPLSKWKGIDLYRSPEKYFSFDKIAAEVIACKPDLVAFSVFSPNYMFYKRTAEFLKQRCDLPILVGGVLPTLKPEMFMENSRCDYLVRGEAEPVIVDAVEKIVRGDACHVPNMTYRNLDGGVTYNAVTEFIQDIDAVPFYDKSLYASGFKSLYLLTSRGCPMTCAYCSAGRYSKHIVPPNKKVVRKRKVDCIIEEIQDALREKDCDRIFFYDDVFVGTVSWLEEFSEKYRSKIGIPYFCTAFPSMINPQIASLLAESNCKNVQMGFQTANDAYKKNVLKRMETKAQVARAIRHLKDCGISYNLDHIFNFPGETREHIEESLDFYIEHQVPSLSIYFLNYFPDAPITEYAHQTGVLDDQQYALVMRNELVGEQSYKGTITDERRGREQIQYALLFRLLNWLPGKWVKMMFTRNWWRRFPSGRYFYYLISALAEIRGRGMDFLLIIMQLFFPPKSRPPQANKQIVPSDSNQQPAHCH